MFYQSSYDFLSLFEQAEQPRLWSCCQRHHCDIVFFSIWIAKQIPTSIYHLVITAYSARLESFCCGLCKHPFSSVPAALLIDFHGWQVTRPVWDPWSDIPRVKCAAASVSTVTCAPTSGCTVPSHEGKHFCWSKERALLPQPTQLTPPEFTNCPR